MKAALQGLYPERSDRRRSGLEALAEWLVTRFVSAGELGGSAAQRILDPIEQAGLRLADASDAALRAETGEIAAALRRDDLASPASARAFALVREMSERVLGLRHHDVQLLGGRVMLDGGLAEMDTGEGKTLTAVLPAATAALAGIPVHVVTVNDYLAQRDVRNLAPLYEALGLRVAVVTADDDPDTRRRAYRADVTYVTNKELAFDYLKDRIALAGVRGELALRLAGLAAGRAADELLLLRGLRFAIVDEADSVLVDEARTPLIISAPASQDEHAEMIHQALELAGKLRRGEHFALDRGSLQAWLTPAGRNATKEWAETQGGLWSAPVRREELATQALTVVHLFERDEHYLVRDDTVQIIDEYTGRVMPDRQWHRGIQQLVEAKEGVPLSGVRDPRARISYQRFFRRYLRLAGMTGTAREVAGEMRAIYGLSVRRVPPHRESRRETWPVRVLPDPHAKWQAIAARAAELRASGRPTLIGTRSVAASEQASAALTARGVPHRVLNARQDEEEADIVSRAGEPGAVTVATNMAGRGTDIALHRDVIRAGGLHVILSERHEAGRIDRQLAGRCGRQGDPGSVEAILSLEDPILRSHGRKRLLGLAGRLGNPHPGLSRLALGLAQRRAERGHRRTREAVQRSDLALSDLLAFSGPLD